MINLCNHSTQLLKKCLLNHRPDLLYVIDANAAVSINENLGNDLREAVGDELIQYGFDNEIPNEYGNSLENLIDEVGRLFMSDKIPVDKPSEVN
ncbi:MAG: hypothetical protein LBL34_04425 [Clostridiales bacterium]|nr:hypothetical protein [Clostridiales bacterium]